MEGVLGVGGFFVLAEKNKQFSPEENSTCLAGKCLVFMPNA